MLEGFKSAIREGFCVRDIFRSHVVQVLEILRTVNGEKMEMVVKEMISSSLEEEDEGEGEGEGGIRKVSEMVVNPEAVEYFQRFRDWEGDEEPSKEKSKL